MQKKFVALCLLASVSVMSVRAMDGEKPQQWTKTEIENIGVAVIEKFKVNGLPMIGNEESGTRSKKLTSTMIECCTRLNAYEQDQKKLADQLKTFESHNNPSSSRASVAALDATTSVTHRNRQNTADVISTLQNFIRTEAHDEIGKEIEKRCQPASSAGSTGGPMLKPTARDIELIAVTPSQRAVSIRQGFDFLRYNMSETLSFAQKIRAGVIGADYFLRFAGSYNSMSLMGGLLAKLAHFKGIGTVVTFATTKALPLITATKAGAAAWTVANCTLPCMVAAPVVVGAAWNMYQGGKPKFDTYCNECKEGLADSYAPTKMIFGNRASLGVGYTIANLFDNARLPFKGIFDLMTKRVV